MRRLGHGGPGLLVHGRGLFNALPPLLGQLCFLSSAVSVRSPVACCSQRCQAEARLVRRHGGRGPLHSGKQTRAGGGTDAAQEAMNGANRAAETSRAAVLLAVMLQLVWWC